MPSLIESHVHLNYQHMIGGYDTIELRDWQEIGTMAAVTARPLLMDGWTTTRDPGASLTGIRTVIDRGELEDVSIDLWPVSAVISAGDRLRVEISSSNFPRFDAHPNVAGNPAYATAVKVARQTIHHGSRTPSHVSLRVHA